MNGKFLVIGAKKAGTTYVHEQLRTLSEIFVPPLKETHFLLPFDLERKKTLYGEFLEKQYNCESQYDKQFLKSYFLDNSTKSVEKYEEILSSGSNLFGECDPELMLLDKKWIQQLKESNFKIVCILRNPVDRFFSHVKMITQTGIDPNKVIADKFGELKHQIHHSLYHIVINAWKSVYGEDILFVDQKELRVDRLTTINKIVSYISSDQLDNVYQDQIISHDINVGSSHSIDPDIKIQLESFFAKDLDFFHSLIKK